MATVEEHMSAPLFDIHDLTAPGRSRKTQLIHGPPTGAITLESYYGRRGDAGVDSFWMPKEEAINLMFALQKIFPLEALARISDE
jgi:hypothetical protein